MKTKLITTVIAFILLSINVQAGNGNNGKETKGLSIEQQISDNISYPDFVKLPMNLEQISVKFTVNENFEMKIKEVLTNNEKLKDYVLQELDKLKLNTDSSSINKNYVIRLIFK